MDKQAKFGSKTVVFILRGVPADFHGEMIIGGLPSVFFAGSDLTQFFGEMVTENESFKKNFTAV